MDTLNRRHRRSTERRGERPSITNRDRAVLRLLTRYRWLNSRDLFLLLPDDVRHPGQPSLRVANPKSPVSSAETDFKKRLRRLSDWGYIHRALNEKLGSGEIFLGHELYEIWDDGILELEWDGGGDENLTGHRIGSHAVDIAHGLMVCSAVASIELGIRATPDARFIPPSEILANAPPTVRFSKDPWLFPEVAISYDYPAGRQTVDVKQRSDCPIFGISYNTGGAELVRFITIEAERTNSIWAGRLDKSSYLRKCLVYQKFRQEKILHKHYNIPNFFVLTIAPSKTHVQNMIKLVMEITENAGSATQIFAPVRAHGYKYQAPPLNPNIFHDPLETAGKGTIQLSRP